MLVGVARSCTDQEKKQNLGEVGVGAGVDQRRVVEELVGGGAPVDAEAGGPPGLAPVSWGLIYGCWVVV